MVTLTWISMTHSNFARILRYLSVKTQLLVIVFVLYFQYVQLELPTWTLVVYKMKMVFIFFLSLVLFFQVEQIQTEYRKLALELHPDKNSGDKDAEARFQKIQVGNLRNWHGNGNRNEIVIISTFN